MKLSVGCNWDPVLVEELAGIAEVTDLCGMLNPTVIGCGSLAYLAPPVTRDAVADYVKSVHAAGKTMTIILDAPNMEAMEWEPEVHRRVLDLFGWLEGIGVDFVELAIPYLVELVHVRFPKLKIKVSPITRTASVDTAVFLQEMGADMVAVEQLLQRDFGALRLMAKDSPVPIMLDATDGTLRGSPSYGNFDYAWTNAVQSSDREELSPYSELARTYNPAFDDWYKVKNPAEIIRCNFIRPEDLHYYEELGIENFKLDLGIYTTDHIVKCAEAYAGRRYLDSMVELANLFYAGHEYQVEKTHGPLRDSRVLPPDAPPQITRYFQLLDNKGYVSEMVRVDNPAMTGYLKHVVDGECRVVDCQACLRHAGIAVTFEEDMRELFTRTLDEYRNCLTSGAYL